MDILQNAVQPAKTTISEMANNLNESCASLR